MSQSEALTPIPPHFVAFVWRYLSFALTICGFAPVSLRANLTGQEYFCPVPHYGRGEDGDIRDSQVPGEPFVSAVLSDPGPVILAKPLRLGDVAPRV